MQRARIELIGRGEGVGRADVEAARGTCRNGRACGCVGRELQRGQIAPRNSQEPMLARHQIGVLALPAEPGASASGFSITGAVSTNTFTSRPKRGTTNCASCFSCP